MLSQYCPQRRLFLIQCQGEDHLGRRAAGKSQTLPSTSEAGHSHILVIPQLQCGCKLDLSCDKGLGNLTDLGPDTQHTHQGGCMPQCTSVSKQIQHMQWINQNTWNKIAIAGGPMHSCDSLDICHSIFRCEHGSLCRGTAHSDIFPYQSTLAACAWAGVYRR